MQVVVYTNNSKNKALATRLMLLWHIKTVRPGRVDALIGKKSCILQVFEFQIFPILPKNTLHLHKAVMFMKTINL